ncbi:asparagine synthase (glutamine-hydrolyzing) [Bradyrhizobium elkanii]|uniref:asparagine synthase (glutamine-hydrolyzing) n=1 Tax=Bradyrhizobium elkanii TaxID=29448 RepID=UPI001AEAA6A8|nr:asparagine synthase (glutamine-hydrolyzing) [Bradyrhizobium elkanii]MBP2434200.1 asparagine synthase (glutamine-hydrolyzing) [Bradyrhizobium elkanii]WLA88889.1 asparagine synthase (glutamine-hydrolyzing) [Bradyrhizobium elkanii]
MCGIAGILHRDGRPVSITTLTAMTDIIAHRGPDGEGHYCNGPVGLGHRRLSIIDLTDAARQPMETRDGRYVLTYNGEIYNFKELKIELSARGHIFNSSGDSEVLLHSFAEWGLGALLKLNGMFAFAIWDNEERRLTLARDRFGVKPVYYSEIGQTFVFASEHKAFRALPEYTAQIDVSGLSEYLTFQNFFGERTLFAGVKLLPAGCYLQLSPDGGRAEPVQYWDFHFEEPEHAIDERGAIEELDRLFRQAVNRQLISDVEVGCYLSGGMDSGSIAALAAGQLPFMRTFTVGFDLNSASGVELGYDERAKAEHMSYLFKTEHYEMVLKAGDMERALPRLAWHLEEPRVGQSYPNFYAAKLASKFGKVVLTGTGGDELFGGYPWRYYRAVVNDDFDHYIEKYFGFWQRMVPSGAMPQLLQPVWEEARQTSPIDIFRGVFKEHASELRRPEDYVNHSLYFEAKTFLNGLLVVDDKLAMAHGLESRVPFLDNDLVDFAMKLPAKMKLGNLTDVVHLNENEPGGKAQRYYERTRDGKLILRKMMGRHIPDEVARREKQGFSAPDASWFKGESIEYVKRRLFTNSARIYDLVDRKTVRSLVDDHLEGRENRRLLIWSLLNLEQLMDAYL